MLYRKIVYNKKWIWSGIEVVITSYTGTVVVASAARGFESHSLRHIKGEKRMKIGFTIGKFAPLHKGHQYLIEKALNEMDKFYVIIYETDVMQIPIETRASWIKAIYPEVFIIYAKNPPSQYGLDEKSVRIQMDYLRKIIKGIKVTHFYNSEPYGKFVAKHLGIQEVQIDRKRKKYPISGTAIRRGVEENESYMEEIVYQDMKKI